MISERDLQKAGNTAQKRFFAFAEFSFDADDKILWREGELIGLPPKTCELLAVFIENAGQILTREELMNLVWKDTFVEEANLSHHIAVLRKSLGENKKGEKFIQTIPRKGYRFIAPVSQTPPQDTFEITVSERTTTHLLEEIEIDSHSESQISSLNSQAGKRRGFWTQIIGLGAFLLIIGAAIFAFLKFKPTANSEQIQNPKPKTQNSMTFARITNSGKVGAVSISPDGKFAAYIQNYNEGPGTLYIRQTDTNIENRLATYEKGEFGMTAFSPDGAYVFYVVHYKSQPNFALYRVPVVGGSSIRLVEKLDTPYFALSPDAAEVAIVREDDKQNSLVAIRLDGSESERILVTRPHREMTFLHGGTWSPDGQKIVFPVRTAAATNNYSQFVTNVLEFNLTTGELKKFTEETWSDFGIMRWMPDASGVVVIGTRPQLRNQIYFIANPSGEVSRITNDTNGYGNYGLGITNDGSKLVADIWEFEGRIWKMDANGDMKTAVLLPTGNTTSSNGLTTLPDGRIIFSTRTDLAYDLWTMSETESQAKPLTSDAFYDSQAVAAPDGAFIVFVSDRAGTGTRHLFRINTDGSRIEQITFGEGIEDAPDISPDGKWIIYYSEFYDPAKANIAKTIRKIPIGGGSPVPLIEDCFVPAFSPDGQMFACAAPLDNYHGKIIVGNADGGQILKIFDVDIFYHTLLSLRWTPDGTGIIFRNLQNQNSNLWKQNLAGGAPVKLTDFKSEYVFNFTFSRDGKHLFLARGNSTVNVIMFKNFNRLSAQ